MKQLKRSRRNKVFLGVCGGLGEYFKIDPTLVRVIWILLTILSAGLLGIIAYIIIGIVVPE